MNSVGYFMLGLIGLVAVGALVVAELNHRAHQRQDRKS